MKKIMFTLMVICMLVALIGADIYRKDSTPNVPAAPKKFCKGYTIIEFGKGLDCNGDTIKLVKVNGGQELVRDAEEPS